MSVDDMITRVEGLIDDVEGIPEDFAQSIIAALRAAELMRRNLEKRFDLYVAYIPEGNADFYMREAIEDWDAAMKG